MSWKIGQVTCTSDAVCGYGSQANSKLIGAEASEESS